MENIGKKAFELAEKELKEKQVEEVKKIVVKTLEKINDLAKKRKEFDEEIRLLKMDIEDLKEGKLDRIVERQEKDPKAKEASVVIIIKEKEVVKETNPWYWPYRITWQIPTYSIPTVFNGDGINLYSTSNSAITCSVAKNATVGTYTINNEIVHLR